MNQAKPKIITFKPGEDLFREGETPSSLFMIRRGRVLIRKAKGGAFVELARISENEVLGELSFFDREPRSATATALTTVEAMEVDYASLEEQYKKVPKYIQSIIRALAERLRGANNTIRRLQAKLVDREDHVESDEEADLDTAAVLAATADVLGEGHDAEGDIPSDIHQTSQNKDDSE